MTEGTPPLRRGAGLPLHPGQEAPEPPSWLPVRHLLVSYLWLGLGAAGLVWVAPLLAQGRLFDPPILAVTHVFTLGWITTTITGVLYQLFPVILGVPPRSIRLAGITLALLTLGTAILVLGFLVWQPLLLAAAWVILSVVTGLLAWNLLPQRRRAPRGKLVGLHISIAHMALGLVLFLAAVRIGDALGWWTTNRLGIIAAHFHLAAFGFATLTAVGVGTQILPGMLRSTTRPLWPLHWIAPISVPALIALGTGAAETISWLFRLGGLLLAAAMVLLLISVGSLLRSRRSTEFDPTAAHVGAALLSLGAATGLGLYLLLTPSPPYRLIPAYAILVLLGWLTNLILGVSYRILPALAAGRRGPDASGGRWWCWLSAAMVPGGVAVLTAGVATASETVSRWGAACFAAGAAAAVLYQVPLAWRRVMRRDGEESRGVLSH
jgi:hypothetical protein